MAAVSETKARAEIGPFFFLAGCANTMAAALILGSVFFVQQ